MSAALGNLSKLNCARLHDISVLFTCLLVYLFTKIVAILKDIFCFSSGQPHGFTVGQFGLQPVFPVSVGDSERRALVQGAVLL